MAKIHRTTFPLVFVFKLPGIDLKQISKTRRNLHIQEKSGVLSTGNSLVKAVKIQTENRHPGQQVCKTSAGSIPGVCILKLLLLAKVLIRKRL